MTKKKQQQVVLGVLFGILALLGTRFLLNAFGERGGGGAASAGRRGSGEDLSITQVENLRIADLELEGQTLKLGRDPFRFFTAAPEPPPPAPAPVQVARPVQTPTPRPRPTAPAVPQPPPVDVVYLGRFGPSARPIAVFSDGKEIFNARQGGVLKGSFVVDKIGYESADLRFVGFPDAPSQRLAAGG